MAGRRKGGGKKSERLWDGRFWGEVAVAAALQHARDTFHPRKHDKLRRSRLRPFGRAIRKALQQSPADTLADLYDPDAITRQFYKPAEDYQFLNYVPVRTSDRWNQPLGHHRIQVPSLEQVNGRWVVKTTEHIVRTAEALQALSETIEYRRARFAEATGDWRTRFSKADYKRLVEGDAKGAVGHAVKRLRERTDTFATDSDRDSGRSVTQNIDQEYIPLTGGSFNRQLYLFAHWEQTSKAFYERHHNDLAKATIGIVSDFTLGRGITVKIGNPKVQAVWDEFWARNDMEHRLRQLSDDLCWQGELMIRKFERPKGFLCIRSLDPGAFTEIVTDPNDVESVYFYNQQAPQPYQLLYSFRGRNLNVPATSYVINQYPPHEMFHVKSNVSATEKWGRSDFFASFGTLKRHRDWTNASTLKDMLQANLVWKIKIHGDQADVDAFAGDPVNAQLPAFGGTWLENDALTLEALHQDVSAGGGRMGQGSVGHFLTALYAAGQNMPVSYFNAIAGGAARATALTQGEPFVKKIATRQQQVRQILEHLFVEVMQRAVAAGRLQPNDIRHEDADPSWIFPSTYEEDRGAKFRDLSTARDRSVISHQTMSTQMAQELNLGEYEYATEQGEIADERTRLALETWPIDTELAVTMGVPPKGMQPAPVAVPPGQGPPPEHGAPGADGHTPDSSKPGEVPNPDEVQGRNEELAGADARRDFRQQQQESLTAEDQAFLEAALPELQPGESLLLPSGRVARAR